MHQLQLEEEEEEAKDKRKKENLILENGEGNKKGPIVLQPFIKVVVVVVVDVPSVATYSTWHRVQKQFACVIRFEVD